jgi:hypothetical protein
MIRFSYGDPNEPRPDDVHFATEDGAIKAALDWCEKHDDLLHSHVLAIWRESEDVGAETIALIYSGEEWRP